MKKFLQKFLLITLLFVGALSMSLKAGEKFDEEEIVKRLPFIAGSGNAGREYWFSIPPCYEEESTARSFIRIYCVAPSPTTVVCEVGASGYYEKRKIGNNGLSVFDITPVVGQPFMHNGLNEKTPPARVYRGKGIHVLADDPIAVYVMVRYKYTSDGFLGIPMNTLGKEYIAAPYRAPQFNFGGTFASWINITSPYDNTKFTVTMGGDIISSIVTESKTLKAGNSISVLMNRGDVYCMGVTNPSEDLCGTKILANKPVSVVTGIHCARVPLEAAACDYNCEMELPSESWGQAIMIPELHNRLKPGIIRIMVKYPGTKIYRDGNYWMTMKKSGGTEPEGWVEERASSIVEPPRPIVYTADKPFYIMYYNPGTSDDNSAGTDPFQMVMTPIEQFQNEVIFCPANAAGGEPINNHFMNVVFELNPFGFMPDDMEYGTWTGSIWEWKKLSGLTGRTTYFPKIDVSSGKFYGNKNLTISGLGVYRIRSKTSKFGCYSYGYDYYDSYGYPTNSAMRVLETKDTICPLPKYIKDCDGSVGILNPATVIDRPDDESIRSNLSEVFMISDPDSSYNYDFKVGEIISGETINSKWSLTPIDPFLDSRAVLVFKDRAGNDTLIVIENFATKLKIYKDQAYGNFKPGDLPVTKDFWLKNESKKAVTIKELNLKFKNKGFSIEPLSWVLPKVMAIGDSLLFKVTFTPDVTLLNSGITSFLDSIGVGDECLFGYKVEVRAGIGEPEILVDDYNFGQVNVADANAQTKVIRITNTSKAADLAIIGFTALHLTQFTTDLKTLYPNISKANPLIVAAGKYKEFTASFKPNTPNKFKDTIIFSSDARITDSLCILEGEGIKSELKVNSYDWGEKRINRPAFPITETNGKDVNGEYVFTLTNDGSKDVIVENITFVEATPGDATEFLLDDKVTTLDKITSTYNSIVVPAGKNITKQIYFSPKTTGPHEVKITFNNQANITGVVSTVKGVGLVPRINITPVVDFGSTIVKDNNNPNKQNLVIYNPAKTTATGDWIYGDTVTITSLKTNTDISSDIATYGTSGFRYDGNSLVDDMGNKVKITVLKPYKLAPGDSLRILQAEFVAQIQPPVTSDMDLVSDADVDNSLVNSKWLGSGLVQTWVTTTENVTTCVGSPQKINLTISNTGTAPFILSNFALSNSQYLTFDNGLPASGLLGLGESRTFTLIFAPQANVVSRTVQLTYNTDVLGKEKQSIDFTVDAYSFTGGSTSSMHRVSANAFLDATNIISVQDQVGFRVMFNSGTSFVKANVRTFNVTINYFSTFLKAILDKTATSDLNKYSLMIGKDYANKLAIDAGSVSEIEVDPATQERKISFTLNALNGYVFDGSGELVTLRFNSFLPSYTTGNASASLPKDANGKVVYSTKITHNLNDGNNLCFDFNPSSPALIQLNPVCAADIRPIVVGASGGYALQEVNPNPVTSAGGLIKFRVATEGATELSIINSAGQSISVPVNSVMKEGEYEVAIPIQDLGSGTYNIVYRSGFFTDTKQLIIQK
jgi:hypothetical protein